MCGIVAVALRNEPPDTNIGKLLVAMLSAIEHRGPDSTGVAIYNTRRPYITIKLAIQKKDSLAETDRLLSRLEVVERKLEHFPRYSLLTVALADKDQTDEFVRYSAEDPDLDVHSLGYSVTIMKDTVSPDALDRQFNLASYRGSHGIGHVRLATESKVDCGFAHPFQSLDLPDLSIVHNGQITNYYKTRRMLEGKGFRFQTDNDSELIAQALAYYMLHKDLSFTEALHQLRDYLDGTFSFVVATPDEIGIAKDKLAAKPMMVAETDWAVAIASEEIGIRSIFGDNAFVRELPPSEVGTWKLC